MTRAITRVVIALGAGIALSASLVGCSGLTQAAEVRQGVLSPGFTAASAGAEGEVASLADMAFPACTDVFRGILKQAIPGGVPVLDLRGAGFPDRFPAVASCGSQGTSSGAHVTYMLFAGAQQVVYDGLVSILVDDGWIEQPAGEADSTGHSVTTQWMNATANQQLILQSYTDDSVADLDFVGAALGTP